MTHPPPHHSLAVRPKRIGCAIAGAAALSIALAALYAPAGCAHREARRGTYWSNVRTGAAELDRAGLKQSEPLVDDHRGPMLPVRLDSLMIELPLTGTESLKTIGDELARTVTVTGPDRVIAITRFAPSLFDRCGLQPSFRALELIATTPPPSYFWPLLPSAIVREYLRYQTKITVLGESRSSFDNGSVRGVLGRAGLYTVSVIENRSLLSIGVNDESAARAIAARIRTVRDPSPPEPPSLAECIRCQLEAASNCTDRCAGTSNGETD